MLVNAVLLAALAAASASAADLVNKGTPPSLPAKCADTCKDVERAMKWCWLPNGSAGIDDETACAESSKVACFEDTKTYDACVACVAGDSSTTPEMKTGMTKLQEYCGGLKDDDEPDSGGTSNSTSPSTPNSNSTSTGADAPSSTQSPPATTSNPSGATSRAAASVALVGAALVAALL